jgi:hypothetical protein
MSKEINYEKIALIRMKAQSNHEITISLQIEFSILTPQAQYRDGIEGRSAAAAPLAAEKGSRTQQSTSSNKTFVNTDVSRQQLIKI